VLVLYGPGQYADYITDNSIANFYREIINSTWIDWLSEYNVPSSNFTIQRGSFIGTYPIRITHGTRENGVTVTDQTSTAKDLQQAIAEKAVPRFALFDDVSI
jgi:hypothetical protein